MLISGTEAAALPKEKAPKEEEEVKSGEDAQKEPSEGGEKGNKDTFDAKFDLAPQWNTLKNVVNRYKMATLTEFIRQNDHTDLWVVGPLNRAIENGQKLEEYLKATEENMLEYDDDMLEEEERVEANRADWVDDVKSALLDLERYENGAVYNGA